MDRKEFLISEIHRWIKEHGGKVPARDSMKASEGYPSPYQYEKCFGTRKWVEILEEIGLNSTNKIWTDKEIKFLEDNWEKLNDEEIGKQLNRTKNSVRGKRTELDLKRERKTTWTEEEIEYLKENYRYGDMDEIAKKLKRSKSAIGAYANQNLGIVRVRGKYISEDGKYRTCRFCQNTYPNTNEYFYKDGNGMRTSCIKCDTEISEQTQRDKGIITYKLKHEKFDEGLRYCGKCKSWKNINDFYATNKNKTEKHTDLHRWCIDCEKEYHLARRVKIFFEKLEMLNNWKISEIEKLMVLLKDDNLDEIYKVFKNKQDLQNKIEIIKKYLSFNGAGKVFYSSKGDICLSIPELQITEFFISNKIKYKREPKYSEVLKQDNTKRKFDWKIFIKNKIFYIEYFGLYEDFPTTDLTKNYKNNVDKKLRDIEQNKLTDMCIFIFPKDIENNSLSDFFKKYFDLELNDIITINYKTITQYDKLPDEEFFNIVMQYSDDKNYLPSMQFLHDHHSTLYNEIKIRFGDYYNFSKKFNLKERIKPKNYWTKEKAFDIFNYMRDKYGKILNDNGIKKNEDDNELKGLVTAYRKYKLSNLKLEYYKYLVANNSMLSLEEIKWINMISKNEGYIKNRITIEQQETANEILNMINKSKAI